MLFKTYLPGLNIENGESGTKIFVILKLLKVLKLIKDCGIVSEWSYHRHNKRSFFNIIFEHVNKGTLVLNCLRWFVLITVTLNAIVIALSFVLNV